MKRRLNTVFAPKHLPQYSVAFTPLAKRILEAAEARTGARRSDLIEYAVRRLVGQVRRDDFVAEPADTER